MPQQPIRRFKPATTPLLLAALMLTGASARAADPIKIGLILPLTGPSASTGRQIEAAAKLYMARHGATINGAAVELIVKDDTGTADVTKRIAQDMIVNQHVAVIAGFGTTPLALAVAPLATQAKVPEVVMAAATSIIPSKSPFILRSSFTLPQVAVPLADWAFKHNVKSVVTLVSNYAPGIDAAQAFGTHFTKLGGKVLQDVRVPLASPDFAPFLQRVKDAKPDAVFLFVPSGQGASLMKQVITLDFAKADIKVIATGDVTDDDQLESMGDAVLGMVTAHHYSAAHPSQQNQSFVKAFEAANPSMRPNFMAVGGYDGMRMIYRAIKKVGNATHGAKLVEAMKGMSFKSPRGAVAIDPSTRDITQNVYIREVRKVDGHLFNVETDTIKAVKADISAN